MALLTQKSKPSVEKRPFPLIGPRLWRYRSDILITLALMGFAAIAAYGGAQLIGSKLLIMEPYGDTWFDSDVAAYYSTLADPQESILHARNYKHPLLSFVFCLPVYGLQALNVDVLVAVRWMTATTAALWLGSLFGFLRLIGCSSLEAVLLSLISGFSASGMFWLPVLESYPLGSLGYVWALAWLAITDVQRIRSGSSVMLSVFTMSITVTNWLVGWIATALTYRWKQVLRIHGLGLLIVMVLAGIQRLIFNSSLPFQIPSNELRYVTSSEAGGPWNVLQAFLFHTMVMPDVLTVAHPRTGLPMMSVQFSAPGTGSVMGAIAIGFWLALLALGLWRLFTMRIHLRLRVMLGISLLAQLGLHLIYTGRETFLYSLHFLPFWIGIIALGTFSNQRWLFVTLLVGLLVSMGFNNVVQFQHAIAFYQTH